MEDLLLKKFADPRLKPRLLSTGEQYLAEINWWGVTFWGICNGRGLNQLGKLSMKVRSRLRSERSGEDRWSIDVGAMATFFLQRSRTRRRKSEQMGSRSAGADL
jgi:hypothetical protein